ncbi:hypothetical protein EOL96_02790 [Candidatus Saccharibacteria bacterium]|nr:hypothetical protein [Candidatus Saccharibacteria bacterium]
MVLLFVLVASVTLFQSKAYADDRPINFKFVNTFIIEATCEGGPCYWTAGADSDNLLGRSTENQLVFVRGNIPESANLCNDIISFNTSKGWIRTTKQKSGGSCAAQQDADVAVNIANVDDKLFKYWYKNDDGNLVSVSGSGSTWLYVPGAGGIDNLAELYIQQGGGDNCPDMMFKYKTSSSWGYIAPRPNETNTTSTGSSSLYYKEMVKATGQPITNIGNCDAGDNLQDAGWSLDSLQSNIGRDRDYFNKDNILNEAGSSGPRNGWISLNNTTNTGLTDVYRFITQPYGTMRSVMPLDADGNPINLIDAQGSINGTNNTTSCDIDGIGWIVCPVMTFLAMLNDVLYGFIAGALVVNVSAYQSQSEGTYQAWQQFQNIANVLFIIAFVMIVYSQITGAGLTSYGVKKMLPKLVIVAILVNMSYILCLVAIDLTNYLGYSLNSLFTGMSNSVVTNPTNNAKWEEIVSGVLMAGVGISALLLAVSVPVVLAAFLALAMIALILIARQAIILLLVVVSPVAIALYLLPNTEQWAKKWGKMLFSMLMLFPTIAVVFGASALAATILESIGDDTSKIVALGASAIPLFIVPGLLKGALAATGKLGAKMQGWGDKATGRVGSKYKETSRLGTALSDASKYRSQQRAIKLAKGRNNGLTGMIARRAGGRGYSDKLSTQAASLEESEFNEQVKAASADVGIKSTSSALGSGKDADGNYDMSTFHASSEAQQAAIIEHVMAKGSFDERRALVEASGGLSGHNADRLRKRISEGVYAKGDQNVYGTGIGARIVDKDITDEKTLREQALKNIEAGHVTAEHIVQGESATRYMVDTAKGVRENGSTTGTAASTTAAANLDAAYTQADASDSTRSKKNSVFDTTIGRL